MKIFLEGELSTFAKDSLLATGDYSQCAVGVPFTRAPSESGSITEHKKEQTRTENRNFSFFFRTNRRRKKPSTAFSVRILLSSKDQNL